MAQRAGIMEVVLQSAVRLVLAASVVAGIVSAGSSPLFAQSRPHVPGVILLKPAAHVPEPALQSLVVRHGARQFGAIKQIDVRIVHLPEQAVERALGAFRNDQRITFAEPDYLFAPEAVPNDPYYAYEWHLSKIGAPEAWDITTGSPEVIIAILDSGLDGSHPDLAANIVPGWNFYQNNADTSDSDGHGTGVAGAAAATGNNGLGVSAPAWNCRLMPIRITDLNGYGITSAMASGLTHASDHGVRVANISFRASGSLTVEEAARYFMNRGGVVTIAAGNEGLFDKTADNPYVLTVGATDSLDALTAFSNTGSNLDLTGPGSGILTTTAGGGYGSGTGTSFAAPTIAGVAALVISANTNLTGAQVQQILVESCDDLGTPGWDTSFGWGRVNAARAVQLAVNFEVSPDTTPPLVEMLLPGSGNVVTGLVSITVTATDDTRVAGVEWFLDGALAGTNAAAAAAFEWDTTTVSNGAHVVYARAWDAGGNWATSPALTVTVQNPVPDTIAPTVEVTSPAAGASLGKVTRVSVAASDNIGVAKVTLVVDGKPYESSTSAPATFTWYTSKLSRGPHTLQGVAVDAAGNSSRSAVVTVYK